jgi:hypothetical protein
MSKILMAAIVVMSIVACNSSNQTSQTNRMNKLSSKQVAEGWKLLFDGETTKGWHKYGNQPVGSAWKVKDGCLYLDTAIKENWQIKDGGDIVTDEEFENFHLKMEWKITKGGNSGIIFAIHEDKSSFEWPWQTGPEMQVLDNEGHADAKIIKHRAGDLYDLISSSKETVRPYNEWNLAEIRVDNGKLDLFLNGENIVSTQMWDESWKALIAGSKFKNTKGFGTYKKGRIGLQDHGNEVYFRNIMIRSL